MDAAWENISGTFPGLLNWRRHFCNYLPSWTRVEHKMQRIEAACHEETRGYGICGYPIVKIHKLGKR